MSYNATITALEKSAEWQQALQLFEAMPEAEVSGAPNQGFMVMC